MEIPVRSTTGEVLRQIEVSERVFGVPANEAVAHQTLVWQLSNARQGTSSAKTRSEVAGSTKKLYTQKHTGRARSGSQKSPLRRGGGIVFPPRPRDYHQSLPKKMRRLALRCVLSSKMRDEELIVIDGLNFGEPKTREMAGILVALGVQSSALIATVHPDVNMIKSARNLAGVATIPADLLNVGDILGHKTLVMTEEAVRRAEELWGDRTSKGDNDAQV